MSRPLPPSRRDASVGAVMAAPPRFNLFLETPMKRLAFALVAAGLTVTGAGAAEAPKATYSDRLYGFSLDVPDLGDSEGALVVQRAAFAAAPRDGFAANCNVQIQFLEMKLSAYMDMSVKQLDAFGLELIREEPKEVSGREGAILEYSGTVGDKELGFLALAVGGGDRFWLVTCTAPTDSFDDHRPSFVELLESFQVQALDDG